jgi:hypothetical protein
MRTTGRVPHSKLLGIFLSLSLSSAIAVAAAPIATSKTKSSQLVSPSRAGNTDGGGGDIIRDAPLFETEVIGRLRLIQDHVKGTYYKLANSKYLYYAKIGSEPEEPLSPPESYIKDVFKALGPNLHHVVAQSAFWVYGNGQCKNLKGETTYSSTVPIPNHTDPFEVCWDPEMLAKDLNRRDSDAQLAALAAHEIFHLLEKVTKILTPEEEEAAANFIQVRIYEELKAGEIDDFTKQHVTFVNDLVSSLGYIEALKSEGAAPKSQISYGMAQKISSYLMDFYMHGHPSALVGATVHMSPVSAYLYAEGAKQIFYQLPIMALPGMDKPTNIVSVGDYVTSLRNALSVAQKDFSFDNRFELERLLARNTAVTTEAEAQEILQLASEFLLEAHKLYQ